MVDRLSSYYISKPDKSYRMHAVAIMSVDMVIDTEIIQYKLKRCSNIECRYVKFKGTVTKWPVQKPTHRTTHKHEEHHDATNI